MVKTSDQVVKFTDATHFDVTKDYTIEDFLASIGGPNAKMYPADTMWAISQAIGKKWGVADGSITEAQLSSDLKQRIGRRAILYRGNIQIDFDAQTLTITPALPVSDIIMADFKTHPTPVAPDFDSTLSIDCQDDVMYSVVAELVNGQWTSLKMVRYYQVADNQYVLLTLYHGYVTSAGTPMDRIKIRSSGRAAPLDGWGILVSQHQVTLDKSRYELRTAGTVSLVDQNLKRIGTIEAQTISYKALFDGEDALSGGTFVACVYNTATSKIEIYYYGKIPFGCVLLFVFRQSVDYLVTLSPDIAVDVLDTSAVPYNGATPLAAVAGMPKMRVVESTLPVGYVGRWMPRNGGLYTTNLGSYLYSRVTGATAVTIGIESTSTAENPPMVAIKVDDGNFVRVSTADMPYTLAVTAEPHIITIVTAGNSGETVFWSSYGGFQFNSLTVNAGTATAIEPSGRRIAFIGDSITAGCWVAGETNSVDFRAESTWPAQVAQALGAADYRCAYSGVGITRDGSGGVSAGRTFIDRMNKTHYAPMAESIDIAVINLGTNDRVRDTDTVSIAPLFAPGYREVINAVKSTYPGAAIVLMVPFNQSWEDDIQTIATDLGLPLIRTADWNVELGFGSHPNVAGCATAARRLTAALKGIFGERYFG